MKTSRQIRLNAAGFDLTCVARLLGWGGEGMAGFDHDNDKESVAPLQQVSCWAQQLDADGGHTWG